MSEKKINSNLIDIVFCSTQQPSYRTNLFVCHHCKQPGHIKNHCPVFLVGYSSSGTNAPDVKITYAQRRSVFSSTPFCTSHYFHRNNNNNNKAMMSLPDRTMSSSPCLSNSNENIFSISNFCFLQSSSTGNSSNASSSSSSGGDGNQTNTSGPIRSGVPHGSHIVTRHAPYQMPYHHRGNRSHRGAGHPRGEPLPKKTTGIPRDRLIPVPKHIPGALRDQTGASVVPRQMA